MGTNVIESTERQIAAGEDAPLARALAEGNLAGPPAERADEPAVQACLSPGLRLVWGAPQQRAVALAAAVEAVAAAGRRVLLLSPTEGAQPGAGEVDAQRAAVAAQLRELDEEAALLARLRSELAGFDEPAYRAAAARVAGEGEIDELAPRLEEAQAAGNTARRATLAAASRLQDALAASIELDPVRDALEHEHTALAAIAALDQRHRDLQVEHATLAAQEVPSGWAARARHRQAVEAAEAELRRFADAATAGRRRWLDAQLQAREVIGSRTRADVDAADRGVAEAETAVAAADEQYRRSRDRLAELRRAVAAAQERGAPSEEDRRLVADADARQLPARKAELAELEARHGRAAERRRRLEAEERRLAQRAEVLRANAEARALREGGVVATTPARFRNNPALGRAAFDVVLVDGADALPPAEVLPALGPATSTAVLFAGSAGEGSCVSHLGIGSPGDAAERDGCVVLGEVPATPVPVAHGLS